jgi:linoleoyl-CoA desaturase
MNFSTENKKLVPIRFDHTNRQFFMTAKKRIDDYFKNNNITRYANAQMYFKSFCMLAFYFTPYFLLLFGNFSSPVMLGLSILMGIGMSGIGLSVMHDANHGSFSNKSIINTIFSYSMTIIGGSRITWQLQHNNLHHTFTNIEGHDEDIAPPGFMRFSPHSEHKKIHKFQYLYAWFFYGLMTLMWVTTKDFTQLLRYNKMGLLKIKKTTLGKEMVKVALSKLFYLTYTLVIPIIVIQDFAWWQVLIGFCIMQFTCGLILALIFQPAHVIPDTSYPLPTETGNIENDFAIHQMHTTANFAPNNKILSWFVGGLNYQVEHHLFPNICHIHYAKIAPILKETAKEFGVPYYSNETFTKAVFEHARLLKNLGKADFRVA